MRYVEIAEQRISRVGLGCWQFGAREWGWTPAQRADSIAILRRAVELGVTLFDTAEMYSLGLSERIVGEALSDVRDRVFLATKFAPILPVLSRIERSARRSAERLGTQQIDLYQLHWPHPLIPLRLQTAALKCVQQSGLVRHVGVSNYPLWMWRRAESLLGGPILSNQVHYHLLRRVAERRVLPWAQQNGRVVIAYSPLAQGFLSGKYSADNVPRDVRRINRFVGRRAWRRAQPAIDLLREIAAAHGATPAQIALAWLLHHDNVVVIPGARRMEQLHQNAEAADIRLRDDEFVALTEASNRFHGWRA
ncbi:MAG: aldo/keto reductase [Phycisphaerae bacterium]